MHKVVKLIVSFSSRIRKTLFVRSGLISIFIIFCQSHVSIVKASNDFPVEIHAPLTLKSFSYVDTQPFLKKFDIDLGKHNFIERGKCYTKNTTLLSIIYDNAKRFDISPFLVLSLIKRESNFDNSQVSSKDAFGYMQITKYPVKEYEEVYGKVINPTDPKENIAIGTFYLKKLIVTYDDLHVALIHYQGGMRYFNILKQKNRHKSTPYTRGIVTEALTLYFQ